MQTCSGKQFWPLDPRADEVSIIDIAHALSMICRFGGHCEQFYSVAEHSVHVSLIVPPELALLGLLHDATEAYVLDVPRPLKPALVGYKDIENGVWAAIAEKFGLPLEMPAAIKDADNAVLLAEAAAIMKSHPALWNIPGEPADVDIRCWSPIEARGRFILRFAELTASDR
jgi:5'-deoxynucleotidase YfbR-like HD superfamily hydrolase